MYEELVERLRSKADYMDNNGITLYAVAPFYRECADAIEELSLVAESNARSAAQCAETAEMAVEQILRWIPVTERLPKEGEFVLVYGENLYPNKHDGGLMDVSAVYDCTYWRRLGRTGTITHWMPLPEPPKEEE